MDELMQQLHDIEGLDPISKWPLATGWWIVIAIAVTILFVLAYAAYRKYLFNRSWKRETLDQLARLEEDLSEATARETAVALSEFLRRIAVHRFSRGECAGLTGSLWLKWLTKHDPKSFNWEAKGHAMINAPYAPGDTVFPIQNVKELIQAVKGWVR